MKARHVLVGAILMCTVSHLYSFGKKTFFGTRSQATDITRSSVGLSLLTNEYQEIEGYSILSLAAYFSHSYKPGAINRALVDPCSMKFSGSRVANRGKDDILADYFGLPTDYQSHVCFEPEISNFVMDFDWFIALNSVTNGLFVRFHMPIVHTMWDLNLSECISDVGTSFYPAGYMGTNRIDRADMAASVKESFIGLTTFGDMQEPLKYGRIWGRQLSTRVGEFKAAVGWNYFQHEQWHVGAELFVAAGTGNKSTAQFLFEPIAGNNDHWEVGIGVQGHVDCWTSEDTYASLALYTNFNLSHLLPSCQVRSYDFKNSSPGSRYMLLVQLDSPSQDLLLGSAVGPAAPNQYMRRLVPAINQTTFESTIAINAQIDWMTKFVLSYHDVQLELGYEFWYRSKEKLNCRCRFDEGTWAFKGDEQVYGFTTGISEVAVPLNPTESQATIHKGQGAGNITFANTNIDSPIGSFTSAGALQQLNTADSTALAIAQVTVQTSNPTILLADRDIDNNSALLSRGISNKVFCYLGRMWSDLDVKVIPYFGAGASIETVPHDADDNAAYAQWAVWIKGGFTY